MSNGTTASSGNVAVEKHHRARGLRRRRVDHHTVGVDHLPGEHLGPSVRAEPAAELVGHVAALQPQPRRPQPVAHRQRARHAWAQISGTGSRISARASGAEARSASAEASSGWVCDSTSASTRAR